ncbi:MAG: hypothetical protein M3364_06175 [Actinomycetota bacterium]|nr:hypothetical protein [Actinomycetota bacterium]
MLQARENGDGRLDERVEALATWIEEIAERVRATEIATGDEKTAKELRRAIEAVAKHDPKVESRLADRIDVLMDRVGTLASAVSTTSAELARRDGELVAIRRELDERALRIDALGRHVSTAARVADLEKLRAAIANRPPERPAPREHQRLDRVEGKLALLTERIDTLAPTVTTATAGLAARDGELTNLRQKLEQLLAEVRADPRIAALAGRIDMLASELEASSEKLARRDTERDKAMAALRVRIDDAYGKAGAVISELQRSLATISSRVDTLDELPDEVDRALEATAQAHQLESLRAEVRAGLENVENERTALTSQVDHVGRALDAGKASVQLQLDELTTSLSRIEESLASGEPEQRMDELAAGLDALTRDLAASVEAAVGREDRIEQRSATRADDLGAELRALTTTVASTAGELAALETASSERFDRLADALDSGTKAVRGQLDGLVAALERIDQSTAGAESERMVGELAERVGLLDVALARIADALAGHDSAMPALRARIDDAYAKASAVISELQASLVGVLSRVSVLEELPERLENDGREEFDKVLDVWASDRSSLETRLDEIAALSGRSDSVEEVTRLRELVARLDGRLASSERALAELRSAPDPRSLVDELTPRLEAIERDAHRGFATSGGSSAGDGRFRLELRALELRAEQAEKSARADREHLLVQLDGLASRIDSRLQLLERENADGPLDAPTAVGAQVVPFRTGGEV